MRSRETYSFQFKSTVEKALHDWDSTRPADIVGARFECEAEYGHSLASDIDVTVEKFEHPSGIGFVNTDSGLVRSPDPLIVEMLYGFEEKAHG